MPYVLFGSASMPHVMQMFRSLGSVIILSLIVMACLAAASMHACITSLCSEELCLKPCTQTHENTHAHSHGQYMHTYTRPFVHDQLELKRTLCDVFLKVYRQIRFHVCAHAPHAVFDRQKPYWQSEG